MKKPSSSWCLVSTVIALAGCCRESQAFILPSQSPSALSSRLQRPAATGFSQCFRTSTALQGSSLPPDTPSPTGENSRRRQSRFNKTPKQPEEPKKEARFSKDSHFYTGAIGIGTYSWGDRRDGFFYGDVSSTAEEGGEGKSKPCGEGMNARKGKVVYSCDKPVVNRPLPSFLFPSFLSSFSSTHPTPWNVRK
jgi:hypothetical protein